MYPSLATCLSVDCFFIWDSNVSSDIYVHVCHVKICTDMGYMFMMTKNQSVKQININKNVLNDYQIYWKQSLICFGLILILFVFKLCFVCVL
jgi:hypothetical protein